MIRLGKAMADAEIAGSWREDEMTVAQMLKLDFSKSAVSLPQASAGSVCRAVPADQRGWIGICRGHRAGSVPDHPARQQVQGDRPYGGTQVYEGGHHVSPCYEPRSLDGAAHRLR